MEARAPRFSREGLSHPIPSPALCRVLGLSLCVLLSGCARLVVFTDFDPKADFASLRSFAWLSAPASDTRDRLDQPLLNDGIRAAIERELLAKGFTKISGGRPDFRVGHHLSLEYRVEPESLDRRFGYGPHWHSDGRPFANQADFKLGTFAIDIIDTRKNRLVWRGVAPGGLPPPHSRRDGVRIDAVIAEVLSEFPPR
ncbi:MAG: DUF4136 domain-containing protein [bacterium]|nr:DUF4136 domain-containing protein [bacterium]